LRVQEAIEISLPANDAGEDLEEISDIVGFHLRLAHGAVYRHFTQTFADLGLTQKQVSVLWLTADHPGIAQTGLAQRMRMDRATTMAIVNRLEARDLIERGKSLTDGRKQTLNLTAAGHIMLAAAKAAIRAHEEWLKSRYTEREVALLIDLLSRLHE